ncbi:DUF1810 family protein [Brevundimonas nasdae]|uniref:DUF1810 family protein n=1 Tax=Brevundimonas nasdae TaxID=172043 RepID=UPI00301876B2
MAELAAGRKTSRWMWFVFPQARSMRRSSTAGGVPARFAEGCEGDEAAGRRRQVRTPMAEAGVAHVGRAAVGFELKDLLEVDLAAFGP